MPVQKKRLDNFLVEQGYAQTRSQAQNLIKLNKVFIQGQVAGKVSQRVSSEDRVEVKGETYVSRAAFKLASVASTFSLDFSDKIVLDIGSSTGGFTDYALQHGAKRVIAVDVGTGQLHPKLRADERVEVHEKTDIRDFARTYRGDKPDVIVIDVSFISQRKIFKAVEKLTGKNTQVISMAKPQFEGEKSQLNRGVVKNERTRRDILKSFEQDAKRHFALREKADSQVSGSKGNTERFYLLTKLM